MIALANGTLDNAYWRARERVNMKTVPTAIAILPGRYERDTQGRLIEIEPPRPCPELLTAAEAVRFLRLDNLKEPMDVLYHYRRKGLLRGTQVGRNIRYLKTELMRCLELLTEQRPR